MARLIDADTALENIDEWLDTVGTALIGRGLSYYAELQGCIEDAPTVDAVPVVRCEDCKYGEFVSWCSKYSCRKVEGFLNFHNFYCKDGARKEDAE